MKAVILAAGVGSRLARPFPKCMSLLPTGEQILGRQIRIYREAGIREIFVVTGFKKNLLMEEFSDVFYKYNPLFYLTNTSKSLLCILEYLDDDVIWSNGDVVFDPEVVHKIVGHPFNTIAVNRDRCGAEEVKYLADDKDSLLEISKSVESAHGEAVGVNKILRESVPDLVGSLRECQDTDYFEKGVEICLQKGVPFKVLDISEHRCIEVDFEEDLHQAREIFSENPSGKQMHIQGKQGSNGNSSKSGLALMNTEFLRFLSSGTAG
ncbi:MAG: NTP transferase domain-containing protein [Desulfovibrionales bacterium]